MPTYTFKHKETEEQFTTVCSMAEREAFLKENPDYIQVPPIVAFGDSVRLGVRRIDSGFNDVLKEIKKSHYKSTIQTRN